MSYSTDLRKRVLDFINTDRNIAAASRRFSVSRTCIYKWLNAKDPLRRKKPGPRGPHRLDYTALEQHVSDFPDATQIERATHFGVSKHCIWYGLKKLNITRKKKCQTYKEQCPLKRSAYLSAFELATDVYGKIPVYIDETGFSASSLREYAYARKGICVEDKV